MKKFLIILFFTIYCNKIQSQDYDIFYYMNYAFYLGEMGNKNDNLKIGFLNKKGEIIIEPEYSDGLSYMNNIANVVKDSISGYIDKQGNLQLFPQFKKAYWNGNIGYAINDKKDYAIIDMDGNKITDFKYKNLRQTSEKYISVKVNGKWNFIDTMGNNIFNDSINVVDKGIFNSVAVYRGNNRKLGIIHINGTIITEPIYNIIYGQNYSENWIVKKDGKYGVINSQGEIIVPLIYQKITHVVNENDPIAVRLNNKFGYVNHSKEIIPFDYDEALPFINGIARVKKDGLYHYINKKNKILCSFEHEGGWNGQEYFSDNLSIFKLNGKYGYINKKGETIIKPIFDSANNFKEGMALVQKEGLYGFINQKGEIKIPIKYEILSNLVDDRIMFGIN
ncbi:WG containing repeat-containing protein [Bizionia echini]|uniref:WG containing repeat-containing protein n=1 Tax=Bizionia echini TaxID=649333 RepID=A0A1I5DAD5_9FLAO|nr:WG repeat-containing protein [Bizionia echini]SFN96228.1 WG containing repeat-containing protein [Bizionia echini]